MFAEMDPIASLPTGASADGPPSPASIAGSLTGSLVPLVYVEDFYRKHNCSVRALVIMCHNLTHDDGMSAIDVYAAPWSTMKKSVVRVSSKEYQSEITRRWDIMCAYDPDLKANSRDIPRPSQAKLQMWQDNNPVTDDGERAVYLMLSMRGLVHLQGQRQRRLLYRRYSTRDGWEKSQFFGSFMHSLTMMRSSMHILSALMFPLTAW